MKFGFELEFGTNAAEVVAYLNRKNRHMMPMAEMHRYHCDCGYCVIPGSTLRAQTDSSCSGEIITTPFTNWIEARNVMNEIEEAAIEADGEPGLQAGLHVHVSTDDNNTRSLTIAFAEFMRWEEILLQIAAGRFGAVRNANRRVTQDMRYYNEAEFMRHYPDVRVPSNDILLVNKIIAKSEPYDFERAYLTHRDNDRHSNLNVRTRFNTWEFRLWNSTRVRWRMELWCLISLAMLDRNLVPKLAAVEVPTIESFQTIIARWNPTAGELLTRQIEYNNKVVNGDVTIGEFSLL